MNATELIELSIHAAELTARIWDDVRAAHAGQIDPGEALAHIGTLHQKIIDDRAKVDAEVDAKFPAG